MGLLILIALNAALGVAGFVFLWRRIERQQAEIVDLRAALEARATRSAKPRRVAAGAVALSADEAVTALAPADEGPLARAARAWGLREGGHLALRGPTLTPETARGLTLALLAVAPAIAFFFRADPAAIVASGVAIGAAMMVIALRPIWRSAAWAGVFTASAWALVGFALGAAHADPVSYAFSIALAALAGLAHAHLRRATPGATVALAMAAAALALGSQIGMVSAAGVGFGVIVAAAAIVGALSLRLEAIHMAAFGAALIGLFVLSGQPSAAIWFTPAAIWAGALFFAIAAVRVPQLGPRGVALAGTGAFAPLGAIAAVHAAQHGLASAFGAASALLALAALIVGLIALTALRRPAGLAAMRVTLWVLTFAAFIAVSGAFALALPPPLAAASFSALALGLAALDMRLSNRVWRMFAIVAGLCAAVFALLAGQRLLGEATLLPPWLAIVMGFAAPAALSGATAYIFARSKAKRVAAFFEAVAIILAVASLSLLERLVFAGGATLINRMGFVETGVHAALWLGAALLIGWRRRHGATAIRAASANTLVFAAFAVMAVASALWATSLWSERPNPFALRATLGFLIPSVLFWANWAFWRARGHDLKTRVSLGAGALLLAAFATMEIMQAPTVPNWAQALTGALSFALAVGINFAPGVVSEDAPRNPLRSRDRARSQAAHRAAR